MATAPTVTHSNVLKLRVVSNYASADDVLPLRVAKDSPLTSYQPGSQD